MEWEKKLVRFVTIPSQDPYTSYTSTWPTFDKY